MFSVATFLYISGDLNKDGWTLSNVVGAPYYSVTTRDRRLCPDGVRGAWDRNLYRDEAFSITCADEADGELSPTVDPTSAVAEAVTEEADTATVVPSTSSARAMESR